MGLPACLPSVVFETLAWAYVFLEDAWLQHACDEEADLEQFVLLNSTRRLSSFQNRERNWINRLLERTFSEASAYFNFFPPFQARSEQHQIYSQDKGGKANCYCKQASKKAHSRNLHRYENTNEIKQRVWQRRKHRALSSLLPDNYSVPASIRYISFQTS